MNDRTAGLIFTIVVSLLALPTSSPGQRIEQPRGIFYHQPAASVFGAEAAWINPAALASYRTPSAQLIAEYRDDEFASSWGWVANSERMATGYRRLEVPDGDDYQEWLVAGGLAFGDGLRFGSSYRYFKGAPDHLYRQHFWTVGLAGSGRGTWHWGAVFSNLNHAPGEDGRRTETEMIYSLAYRPIGRDFTVAADMLLSTGIRIGEADYVYAAEYAFQNGVSLSGQIDSDRNFQLGARVNLLKYFVSSRSDFDRDRSHLRTTMIVGSTSLRQRSVIPYPDRRLTVDLSGTVSENPARPVFGPKPMPFASLLLQIYRAAEDPSISEMVLNLGGAAHGFGRTQELRAALGAFRERGKTITAHIRHGGNLDYYLASVADRILMSPVSQLNLVGLRAELTFYAGTFEKLGIKSDVVQIGEYKTAAEQYSRGSSSEANQEQINRVLDDLYAQFVTTIASGRGVSSDSMMALIDRGPFTSRTAIDFGLVDGLSYRDEVHRAGLPSMPTLSFRKYVADTLINDGWPRPPVLAIVVADGEIAANASRLPWSQGRKITPRLMKRAYEQAVGSRDVRAVLLRINSPGGLALAGEDICHTGTTAAQRRPLVVSMANVAASGGYHIAMPASHLFANPASITGSIGIFGGKPNLEGLYDKIDLGKELYTRGQYAGMLSWIRPFTDDERLKYHSHLDAFYQHFVDLVAENREVAADSIGQLAQGKVWTGREALKNGLVDELGGLKDALDYTAGKLRLKDYEVDIYPRKRTWLSLPGGSLFRMISSWLTGQAGDELAVELSPALIDGVYTRLPYDLTID